MSGNKWPNDVRDAALTLMRQLHHQHPDATRGAICAEVARRMDPAPAVNTLLWWGRAYCVFPNMPSLRSVRLVEPIDEVGAVDVDDVESVGPIDAVTAVEEAETLQEMVFTLRTALHDCMRHADADAVDLLRAADRHALALENLVHALAEDDAASSSSQRAITG